ncbi:MAG: DUF502 domain-containing protein [Helicobacter sp.]|nr:DUF502 domain-containing protein [Helicobacter sp.]
MKTILRLIGKGILVVLPLWILVWILSVFYHLIEKVVNVVFNITSNSISGTVIIFAITCLALIYIGYLFERSREFIVLKFFNWVIHKIPLIGSIYAVLKDMVKMFSGSNDKNYLGVGYVKFGEAVALGFITKDDGDFYWLFVPTTPNPTSGILLRYPKDKVERSDISVTEGFKKVVSLGIK